MDRRLTMRDGTRRILLIEDDPAIAASLQELFSLEGYEVIGVSRLMEAIAQLQGQRFDLVITDSLGRTWDPSLSFLDELRALLRGAPLVLCTAHGAAASIDGNQQGLAAVWLKPFDVASMLADVQTLLTPR
jgi:DNA-binding response OmpR family regulator